MQEHINSMLDLVNQMKALRERMADNLVVALLLCSLPDNYDTLITALESRNDEDLTIEMVKGKLINEYTRNNESGTASFLSTEKQSAMKVTKGKAAYTKFACHYCN